MTARTKKAPPPKQSLALDGEALGTEKRRKQFFAGDWNAQHRQAWLERKISDGPFAWFNKAAVEKIRRNSEKAQSCIAVYLALCELASDEQSQNFRAPMERIGNKCNLSRRTVFDRLNDLESMGLIEIERSATNKDFRLPSAYVLLRCEPIAHRKHD